MGARYLLASVDPILFNDIVKSFLFGGEPYKFTGFMFSLDKLEIVWKYVVLE
jgi:hypothetical protein